MATKIQIVSNVEDFKRASDEQIQLALEDIGQQAEDYVSDIAPFDTGRLAGSITHATKEYHSDGREPAEPQDYKMGDKPEKFKVYIGTNVKYAPALEFGTDRQKAQPYIRPGIKNHIQEFKQIVEEDLRGL